MNGNADAGDQALAAQVEPRSDSRAEPAAASAVEAAPITHIEIYGPAPALLADFYRRVLGWRVEKAPGVDYWRIATGSCVSWSLGGGLTYRPDGAPNGWLCYAHVPALDATIALALELGGRVTRQKTAIPKTGWYAMLADPAGNVFGVWQPDPTAFPPPQPE